MPKFTDRTGESRIMNNGFRATIIGYRNANDIDVEFENGRRVFNKKHSHFLCGKISFSVNQDRIGEIGYTKNGLKAVIIKYRSRKSIDVQFENGQILENIDYCHFIKGEFKCPMLIEYSANNAKVTNLNIVPNISFVIDIDDVPIVKDLLWYINSGYIQNDKYGRLHRGIMNAKPNEIVDHVNGDRLDNRKSNLRLCTNAENSRNANISKNNTSGYKGVSWDKSRNLWHAQIMVDKRTIHIGRFGDKLEAAKAYNKAAVKYHGEFALLNNV